MLQATGEPFPVTVHPFPSPKRGGSHAYELGNTSAKNAVVFIGGLTDGPHTTPYIRTVAKHLENSSSLDYSVFEIRMRSSFIGFGTSSLANDVEDISALVKYLRGRGKERIVLFGHSTGCQDCMEYTNYAKHHAEPVDGFILQAPVSDREGLDAPESEQRESLAVAEQMIAEGKSDWCVPKDKVPKSFEAPMSAYRLWSLMAKDGDDDYFSADLEDEKVRRHWGRFEKPVLVLHSGEEEFVPKSIDQVALNKRYQDASPMVSRLSGLIPGAGHAVEDDAAREWLAVRTAEFLETLQ
ncbi:hypothetical protein ACRE_075000 [Hapsidospora chrysogenum ATCC 11550]|uniref:Uncharacterized protein n=1 Tax=Hapsidospora chrysogenum (strain ATCC 11550 / CBS 779.69 / DSM 880 / IAM 14645 / JCM 23072 / IMI 49137) TaxID=857340 RepID=A0A086SXE7_HAPC1|nr:hypothetical protein ACRE_075000 [Hapsidospora chrysogenum ATCC 11550]